jgi:hypothetical protein
MWYLQWIELVLDQVIANPAWERFRFTGYKYIKTGSAADIGSYEYYAELYIRGDLRLLDPTPTQSIEDTTSY